MTTPSAALSVPAEDADTVSRLASDSRLFDAEAARMEAVAAAAFEPDPAQTMFNAIRKLYQRNPAAAVTKALDLMRAGGLDPYAPAPERPAPTNEIAGAADSPAVPGPEIPEVPAADYPASVPTPSPVRLGWFRAPDDIFGAMPVSGYARLVYLYLCRRGNRQSESWPGIDLIAVECGISERSVRRAVKELKTLDMAGSRRRFNSSNVYSVKPPDVWAVRPTKTVRPLRPQRPERRAAKRPGPNTLRPPRPHSPATEAAPFRPQRPIKDYTEEGFTENPSQ